jgi:hypothetical protein
MNFWGGDAAERFGGRNKGKKRENDEEERKGKKERPSM